MTLDEWHEAHEALIAHPDVVAALARRGITDLDLVLIDTWAYGHSLIPAEFQDRRVGWTDVWRRSTPDRATRTPTRSTGCTSWWT